MVDQINIINTSDAFVTEITRRIKSDVKYLVINEDIFRQAYKKDEIFVVDHVDNLDYMVGNGGGTKVIPYGQFKDTTFETPLDNYDADNSYTGIMLGMSHSQCAIDSHIFGNHFLIMSKPSMDLYLHYHYLRKLTERLRDRTHHIENFIIELPYYIFNYDLSCFGSFVYTKLNYFTELGPDYYHNLSKIIDVDTVIPRFNYFKHIFNPLKKNKESFRHKFLKKTGAIHLKIAYKSVRNKDSVWKRFYEETIKDNVSIWQKLICHIKRNYPNAKIRVLVMPFNPLFRWTHKDAVSKMRKLFYQEITKQRVEVIDDFSFIQNPFMFSDHCHLNRSGGKKYTKHLYSIIYKCQKR